MDQTPNILMTIFISIIVPLIVQFIGKKISKKEIEVENSNKESSTYKNITEAANTTVETAQNIIDLYNKNIEQLKSQIDEMNKEVVLIKASHNNCKDVTEQLRKEVEILRLDNSRKTSALMYLIKIVRTHFPQEVKIAEEILEGKIPLHE